MTRYELLDRIGVGGMAEIFRGKAVAAGGFEKPVAIKRILPHLSQDQRFVELLIAEAKVLSLLKHRNIVQIFDVGLGDDGQYFLVMEYVDGKDLGAVQRALEQKRRRLPFDLVLHIGAEICEALEHAHTSRGPDGKPMALVHRDVSPSNVLLSRAGEVKLTDFGIAKRAEEATQSGAVRGKFAYISPEQARNEPLDPRSDVFSVGILMWELTCNRRLFSQLDDLSALRAVREAQVPRPTEVDGRLPAEIDQILLTALARDKQRRFASCGQLGQKLRALRYSLDVTVGDPATELAKVIESTEQVERQSRPLIAPPSGRFDIDGGEATVIRIRTADAFSAQDEGGASISQARLVIDRFEEEETRQAPLSVDQLRILRDARDSRDLRDSSDELTRARQPIKLDRFDPPLDTPPQNTRLVSRSGRAPTAPPPIPAAALQPQPLPPPPVQLPPPVQAPPPVQHQPYAAGAFPAWGAPVAAQRPRAATPTAPDSFDAPVLPNRASVPQIAGFDPQRRQGVKPWMLVVGAVLMALLAFAITRAFMG